MLLVISHFSDYKLNSGSIVKHIKSPLKDNINNLKVDKRKRGSKISYGRRKVKQLNLEGELIQIYSSVAAAAKSIGLHFHLYSLLSQIKTKLLMDLSGNI